MEELKKKLDKKIKDGKIFYFYAGLGWIDEERLSQPDIKRAEDYKKFMYNPENSHNCENCPENNNCSSWGGNLPCGQQNCWVDCHCKDDEEEE